MSVDNKTENSLELRIFANLREILKENIYIVNFVPGTTVLDFLKQFIQTVDHDAGIKFFNQIVDVEQKKPRPFVKIIMDGRILMPEDALFTQLSENVKIIAIFPPIGGG